MHTYILWLYVSMTYPCIAICSDIVHAYNVAAAVAQLYSSSSVARLSINY